MKKGVVTSWKSVYIIFVLVFLLIGLILFFAPSTFLFLFSTILGNLLLIVTVILLGFFDIPFSFGLGIIFIILFLVLRVKKASFVEKFLSGIPQYEMGYKSVGTWPPELVREFLNFQSVHNPDIFFDMDLIQQQATSDDAKVFLKNGSWPWSKEVQRMYRDAIATNSYISTNPGASLYDAQAVYNENAIKQLLSWNSKEGDFLLGGVTIGHPKGMPKNINNTIRCVSSFEKEKEKETVMYKKVYTGYNGINGVMSYHTSVVENQDIPNSVPGFSFLNGVCNPCNPLNSPPDYSCPFIIDTGNGTEISEIWENLWNINGSEKEKEKKKEFSTRDNSYLLGVSRKKKFLNNEPVMNVNTNFF